MPFLSTVKAKSCSGVDPPTGVARKDSVPGRFKVCIPFKVAARGISTRVGRLLKSILAREIGGAGVQLESVRQ